MSPNCFLVFMSPVPLATEKAPSFTSHLAAEPSNEVKLDKSLPSKIMIASEGGSPGFFPGVTLTGFKSQISETDGSNDSRGLLWENAETVVSMQTNRNNFLMTYLLLEKIKVSKFL